MIEQCVRECPPYGLVDPVRHAELQLELTHELRAQHPDNPIIALYDDLCTLALEELKQESKKAA